MKCTKITLITVFVFHHSIVCAQKIPLQDSSIRFAKQAGIFSPYYFEEKKVGRSLYAFNSTYFIDHRLNLNNRKYLRAGYLFYKFERYCIKNKIYYNKNELKKFRKKSLLAGVIFFLYSTSYVPIILNAAYSPTPCPECFYASPLAPLVLALPFIEGFASSKIRSKAERELLEKLFTKEIENQEASAFSSEKLGGNDRSGHGSVK